MIDLQLWLVVTHNTAADREPLRQAHREYMASLMKRGVIFASGPIAATPDTATHGGATVLRVDNETEVRRIMDEEPFVDAGARTYELFAWNVRHGDFASRDEYKAQATTDG